MPCLSKVIRRTNKLGRLIGLSIRCEGTCNSGQACRTTDRPDPAGGPNHILRFCACDEDIPIPPPNPITRENMIRGCRIALRMLRSPQGTFKPVEPVCIGACDNPDRTECIAVVRESFELAEGGKHEIIVCQCLDKVEPVASVGAPKPVAVASAKGAAAKKRRRRR